MASRSAVLSLLLCAVVNAAPPASGTDNTRRPTTSSLFESLIEPMCANAAGRSPLSKDACYGCFSRYASNLQTEDAKKELQQCSEDYLSGTSFEKCGSVVDKAVVFENGSSPAFCDFEKCVRKLDVMLAVESCTKATEKSDSPVDKFLETISCVMDRLRCRGAVGNFGSLSYSQPMMLALYMTKTRELRTARLYPGFNSQHSCEYDQFGQGELEETGNMC